MPPIGPAAVTPELRQLARKLPPDILLGTSSWYFPDWAGIVFDRKASEQIVTREGLHAYGQHALLRTVGIDRAFYAPLPATEFARYAGQVPEHFRFLVKAPSVFVTPRLRDGRGYPGGDNPNFLDATGTVGDAGVTVLRSRLSR